MTDTFRALCAELLQLEQEQPVEYTDWKRRYNAAIARTRAALAQTEPVAPTDEELIEMWHSSDWFNEGATPREFISIARAVLARWGTPANTTNQEDYDR